MSIEGWSIFWKIVFFLGVSTFAILSVLVIFGGAKDIVKLIRRLKEDARESEASGTTLSEEE